MIQLRLRAFHRGQAGQTVVLVCLLMTVLLGFTGLAIDGGRFYAERRFLQSAADAGALGCASAIAQGGTTANAEAKGKDILRNYDLKGDPTGTTVTVSDTPVYNASGSADKRNLIDGIVASNVDCRVAVGATMRTYFIRLFGLQTFQIPANAHALTKGGMLPVVVDRYKDPPGPSTTFTDYTKQEQYQTDHPNTCSENGGGGCQDAAPSDIACTTACLWGPETVISGQGYQSSDSDFRGFIALDVRDFSSVDPTTGNPVHMYYNGAGGMSLNQLKDQEASYVKDSYPGPDLVPYDPNANPVQRELQIATMSGNSAGVVVTNFDRYFHVGDRILVQLFDGQVREIPDFTIYAPSTIPASSPSGPADGPQFNVGANQRFRDANDTVDIEMASDSFNAGASSDTPSGVHTFTFDPDNFVPQGGSGTKVTIKQLRLDGGVPSGIYSVVVRGTGHTPQNAVTSSHQVWVPLNVGGVVKDFAANFTATTAEPTAGQNAVYTFTLTTGSGSSAWGSNPVTVAIDQGTCSAGSIALTSTSGGQACVPGSGVTITASSSFVPAKNSPPTITVTIPTGTLTSGNTYNLVLRTRGTNGSGQPVVHVQPLTLAYGTNAGGSTKYVNVQGYSVFVITAVDSNTVKGRAITGAYASPSDQAVAIGRRAGLLPWESAPY